MKIEDIKDPSFIKNLNKNELKELCGDIREFLIKNISETGGHLASNLGIVEITVGMFYVFDAEKDKFIYDVGHQSYVHKILTGRADKFNTLRKFNGLSGYINKKESKYDIWESGHSSTSISAACGMLVASDDKTNRPIVVIGDSAISNGVAFEGLNFLGAFKDLNPIIIINDNKMGISKSVGAMTKIFGRMRRTTFWVKTKKIINSITPKFMDKWMHQIKRGIKGYLQRDNIFEDMGFDYYGPINGNDLKSVITNLERVKKSTEPVIVHFVTKKGLGYQYAEDDDAGDFHGVSPFDISNGKSLKPLKENEYSYSKIICNALINRSEKEEFYVITPAMKIGAELEEFANLHPTKFYDVGISEEHAAVMAAGIALTNKKVALLMYSTFAQRAYDQFLNDIGRQNLNIVIGIDRAGVVGEDGSTHQGIYDVSMFNSMPNYTITMGKNASEAVGLLNYAFTHNGPIVVRYPRGKEVVENLDYNYEINEVSWDKIIESNKSYVITYGPLLNKIEKIIKENNLSVGLINARFIRPIDELMMKEIFDNNIPVLVMEECVNVGTLYSNIIKYKNTCNTTSIIREYGFDADIILPHGSINEVYNAYGFSDEDLIKEIKKIYEN